MPNKKSKKRLRERKNQRAAKITKKQFIKSNDPNAPNCDINSEDDVMSVEYSDADIDELLLNEDLDECIIEDDYEPQPVLKEKRKFKGYDKNFIKRIDISRVNKDNYQKSLFHKNKEIFERFERIADQNRALNVVMIAEKPQIARVITNILSGKSSTQKEWNNYTRYEFDGEFKGYNAHFTVCSVFGHVYKLHFHQESVSKQLTPEDLFTEKVVSYPSWRKIFFLEKLLQKDSSNQESDENRDSQPNELTPNSETAPKPEISKQIYSTELRPNIQIDS